MSEENLEYGEAAAADIDYDEEEDRRRKRRAAELVKQFLTMKYEEERRAYIEKYNYKLGLTLGTYVEKRSQSMVRIEKSIGEILADFEIFDLDDFADFIADASDFEELDDAKEKRAVNAVIDANEINKGASKKATPEDNRRQANAAATIITDYLISHYAKELLMSDKRDIALNDIGIVSKTLSTLNPTNPDTLKTGLWTLLDASDLSRIAMSEDLLKKIKFKLDDAQRKIESITIDGIELAGDETSESVKASRDNTNLYKVKDIISKAYFEKMNYAGLVGAKLFVPGAGRVDALNEALAEDLTATIPDILDKNTSFLNSSKSYKDIQKAALQFIKNHDKPQFADLDDAVNRKKLQDDLKQLTNVVKKYLDDNGGVDSEQHYKDENERKRIYASREVYRILVNKRQQMDAYCKYQEYSGALKDIEEGTAYRGNSKTAARRILDIAFEDGTLDLAQTKKLKESFDTLCLERLKIVLNVENQPEGKRLSDEQLLERIHNSELYKKSFDNEELLDSKLARQIIDNRLENNIVKAIVEEQPDREGVLEQPGISKVKQADVNSNGGVQIQAQDKRVGL